MEKKYITPEMEIDIFEAEDIITTSGDPPQWNDPNNDTPGGEGWN